MDFLRFADGGSCGAGGLLFCAEDCVVVEVSARDDDDGCDDGAMVVELAFGSPGDWGCCWIGEDEKSRVRSW